MRALKREASNYIRKNAEIKFIKTIFRHTMYQQIKLLLLVTVALNCKGYYLENRRDAIPSTCEMEMLSSMKLGPQYWPTIAIQHFSDPSNYNKPLILPVTIYCTGSKILGLDPKCNWFAHYMEQALYVWTHVIKDMVPMRYNISRVFNDSVSTTSIEVRFIEAESQHRRYDDCPFGATIAHANSNFIHFNMNQSYDFDAHVARPKHYLMNNVIMHELGHTIGLDHIINFESIMYPGAIFNYRKFPGEADKRALRLLYEPARKARELSVAQKSTSTTTETYKKEARPNVQTDVTRQITADYLIQLMEYAVRYISKDRQDTVARLTKGQ